MSDNRRRGSMPLLALLALWGLVLIAPSCVTLKHQIDQDKPLEINVNVRLIDDRLEDFYAFEQKYHGAGATTQPAGAGAGAAATQSASS